MNRSILSRVFTANGRSPEVSSIAFHAQPPDLPPVSLMDMGFAVHCPLARHRRPQIRFLYIGSRVCSALLSDSPHDDALALHYPFTSIRLGKGLSPSSYQACSAHNVEAGLQPGLSYPLRYLGELS